ncbi:MAG: hypothetical protein OXE49_14220 [Gemmatimonadetes bacterium]|nr:hypothetical protein [Gemmatimonadota bacterium]
MQALILYYNRLANYAFDACMAPLAALGRWAEILGVAAVLGMVVSLIFAALVRRERLRQARDELWAALFEIWLYRREPLLVWQAQLALFKANLRYSSILLVPLVLSLLASAPLLIQAHYRFALAPIPSDAETLLTAVLARPAADMAQMDCKLEWVQGTGTLSSSVREPALHRLVWRLRPEGSGKHVLRLTGCGQTVEFPLYVGGFAGSIAPARQVGVLAQLFAPRALPLKDDSNWGRIYVEYPRAGIERLVWLTAVSLLCAFVVSRLVRRYRVHRNS